jgi:hypothetical protein
LRGIKTTDVGTLSPEICNNYYQYSSNLFQVIKVSQEGVFCDNYGLQRVKPGDWLLKNIIDNKLYCPNPDSDQYLRALLCDKQGGV